MAEFITSDALSTRHGFFTRKGGVSDGIYGSLQCGWGAKEDSRENVEANRGRAAQALGVAPDRLISHYQVHSADAVTVIAPWDPADAPEADGMATDRPGIALGVLAADCAPVLLEDVPAGVIGACHAGWKGALGGVIEATIAAMNDLGAQTPRITAVVGPCISQASYEVGPEYVDRFLDDDPESSRFFSGSANEGRAMFNLAGYALSRLRAAGVGTADALWRCTYAEPDLFFSNRRAFHRGENDYGRLLSAIVLEDTP